MEGGEGCRTSADATGYRVELESVARANAIYLYSPILPNLLRPNFFNCFCRYFLPSSEERRYKIGLGIIDAPFYSPRG